MSKYLIRRPDGSIDGPFTSGELRELAYEGRLTARDEISPMGETRWVSASRVGGIKEIIDMLAPETAKSPPSTAKAPPETSPSESPLPSPQADEPSPAVTRTPDAPSERVPRVPPAVSAQRAAPEGFSDRVLRGAFRFARAISVLVILCCVLAICGSVALAAYGLMPVTPTSLADEFETPRLQTFIAECAPSDGSQRDSDQGSRVKSRTVTQPSQNPCIEYRSDFLFVIRTMNLTPNAESFLCDKVTDLPETLRAPFARGLRELAEAYQSRPPQSSTCSSADAVNWYVTSFILKAQALEGKRALEALDAKQRLTARRELIPLGLAIGAGAVGLLLAFLLLPLLIQIERNTRLLLSNAAGPISMP